MIRTFDILVRADASISIGSGHVMRCLTLAEELAARGERVAFVCRELPGDLIAPVEAAGYPVLRLPAPAGQPEGWLGVPWLQDAEETRRAIEGAGGGAWLVVDNYGADAAWERAARTPGMRVAVIDDLADRPHDCDLLLDQNLSSNADRYRDLVPPECRTLLGPLFALLRRQFAEALGRVRERTGEVRRILVFFGGHDAAGLTLRALRALARVPLAGAHVDTVLSRLAPTHAEVLAIAANMEGVVVHAHVDDMAALMAEVDLALGASGGATWERCALGLPAIVVAAALNQVAPAEAAADAGAIRYLGTEDRVTAEVLAEAVAMALADPAGLVAMSAAARSIVPDALGATRVADELLSSPVIDGCRLRPIRHDDLSLVRAWRNSERVRPYMFTRHEITAEEHEAWFAREEGRRDVRHLAFECGDVPMGVVNLTDIDRERGTCEWGFYVGADAAPPGSGTRMGVLALDYAFGPLGLDRVNAEVLPSNERSLAYHSKLGFRETPADAETRRFEITWAAWREARGRVAQAGPGEKGR